MTRDNWNWDTHATCEGIIIYCSTWLRFKYFLSQRMEVVKVIISIVVRHRGISSETESLTRPGTIVQCCTVFRCVQYSDHVTVMCHITTTAEQNMTVQCDEELRDITTA